MNIVVLEHPRLPSAQHFNDIANTPLWSCLMGGYAAAALMADGHGVQYLDAIHHKLDFAAAGRKILAAAPDLLAVNAVYFWEHTPALFDFLSSLRRRGFRGHINLFGFFPTLAFESLLQAVAAVDSVAVGECEQTLRELAGALATGAPVDDVAGLALRRPSGQVKHTVRQPEKTPDRFPFPVRVHGPEQATGILASRGCYNHCSFCPVPPFYNRGALWRGRSLRNILGEVEILKEEGYKEFYFLDPNFVGPGRKGRQRTLALAELLAPLDIEFGMETRPNDLDPPLLEALRAAGLNSLLLGVESASAGLLEAMGKSVSTATAEKAIACCRKVGIEPEIGFLMFLPDSRVKDIRHNFDFLLRNNLLDRLDRTANLLSHRQIVLKGTSGYRRFERLGRLKPDGALGFEGIVSYADPGVERLANEVTGICSEVLQEMTRPASPLSWRKGPCAAWQRKNAELVAEFEHLLDQAMKNTPLI